MPERIELQPGHQQWAWLRLSVQAIGSTGSQDILLYSESQPWKASLGWAWTIKEGAREQPSFELCPQEMLFLLGSRHEASILLGSPGQVRQHFVHSPIGYIFVDREASLA